MFDNIKILPDSIKRILDKTHGIILYQEQVIEIAREYAGLTEQEADVLRHAMGKKKARIMAKVKKGFIEGALNKGYPEEDAENVFAVLEKYSEYCLAGDTLIQTNQGLFSIRDIVEKKLEVLVSSIDLDGSIISQPIVQYWDHGEQLLYEYTLENGESVICAAGHRLMLETGELETAENIFRNRLDIKVVPYKGSS